ncbi:hypothetical protein ACDX78_11050 [Virgibacillus oceani]
MKNISIWISIMIFALLLSGCLYPEGELAENQAPNEDQLRMVQSAVEQYRESTDGLVPIQTKPNDTPIFQKYLIDFTALQENNILTEIPGNAFENGGVYQYTLITPDEDPQVKLIDLQVTEALRSVNVQLNIYRDQNLYPPFGREIEQNIFTVDYEEMGLDEPPFIKSPYSNENLPIVMNVHGELFIDYRIDLNQALSEFEHDYDEGDDIRYLLAENTPFVPAYSFPYTVEDGEPVFSPDL